MNRFLVAFLLVPLASVAACASAQQTGVPAAGQLTPAGTLTAVASAQVAQGPKDVTIHVSCDDTGDGMGVKVHPWKVPMDDATQVTWKLVGPNPLPPATLEPVNPDRWPFDQPSYTLVKGTTTANLKPKVPDGTYRYRLRITCPSSTIVIDPDVVIGHT